MAESILKNIQIYGRSYRVKIKPDEAEVIDSAVEKLNSMLQKFAGSYDGDVQDFMAMTAFYFATESQKKSSTDASSNELISALQKLEEELDLSNLNTTL